MSEVSPPAFAAERLGQLVSVPMDQGLAKAVSDRLCYHRRIEYAGLELVRRKAWLAKNPTETWFDPKREFIRRELASYVDGRLVFPMGLYCRCVGLLSEMTGRVMTLNDPRTRGKTRADWSRLEYVPGFTEFRYRQDEVLATIDTHLTGVVRCPTGYGKSFVIELLTVVYPSSNIVMAVRGQDLLESLHSRISRVCPNQCGIFYGKHKERDKRVTLVSLDSIGGFHLGKADIVLVDECHEVGTDKRASAILSSYTEARFFGFSASFPGRSDGADMLVESVVGPVILDISYEDAARNGAVLPLEYMMIEVPGVVGSPTSASIAATERQDLRKRRCYWDHAHRNDLIAQAARDAPRYFGAADPQVLIMVETIDHAYQLKKRLPDYTLVYSGPQGRAAMAKREDELRAAGLLEDGEHLQTKKDMEGLREAFERGEIRKAISTYVWKQGIDARGLNVFIRADGSVSEVHNVQQKGRLSRVEDGKTRGLIIDFRDSFCDWARRRSAIRESMYKSEGHTRRG